MLERVKHAALVLLGRRPAEVRFDEEDRRIADEVAMTLCTLVYEAEWYTPKAVDDVDQIIRRAIYDYVTYAEHKQRRRLWARRRGLGPDDPIPF